MRSLIENIIINELRHSTTKEQVERIFREYNMLGYVTKKEFLFKAMGVEEEFSSNEKLTDKQEYKYNLELFIEGSWRQLI